MTPYDATIVPFVRSWEFWRVCMSTRNGCRSAALLAVGSVVCLLSSTAFCAVTSNLIDEVVIVGATRVDERVIRDTIQASPGIYFTPEMSKDDTENLMELGEFESVDVEMSEMDGKVRLTYRVVENPILTAISIDGAVKIPRDKVEDEVNSKIGSPLNGATLRNDIERIRELYNRKGYSQVKVTYDVIPEPDGSGAAVSIHIDEGIPSYVREVHIAGNTQFSDARIKWVVMETKPRVFGLLMKGLFDEYTLKEDMWRITELYQEKGYADATATYEVKPTADEDGLAVYVTIVEGPPYRVGKIVIRQAKLRGYFATNLFYEVSIYQGGVYSPQGVERDAESIRNYYRSLGYADALVMTKSLLSEDITNGTRIVDVYFEVQEADLYDFGNIYIAGNTRTKDVVIRRELNMLPGDRYNYYREETSRQRLMNLNYFDKVDMRDTDSRSVPNAKDVYVNVKEKRTGRIGIGAGYSSVDEFVGFVEVSQGNFDAFNWRNGFVGGGQKVRLRLELGNERQDAVFSFTEPYFLHETLGGRRVSAGFDLFARNHTFYAPDYQVARIGGDVRAGTPFRFDWIPVVGKYIGTIRADLTALGEVVNVRVEDNIAVGDFVLKDDAVPQYQITRRVNPNNGRIRRIRRMYFEPVSFAQKDKYLKAEEGTYGQMGPALTLTRDTRDSLVMPTRGGQTKFIAKGSFGTEMYGLGEFKHAHYFKLFETFRHKPHLPFSGPHVLELRGAAGIASQNTPLFDRFFLGGPYEMRGFAYRMAGPKDYQKQNALGGTTKLFGSVEYTFPIWSYNEKWMVRGALWMDMGDVWWKSRTYAQAYRLNDGSFVVGEDHRDNAGEINMSCGMGLRVITPIGPLRLDYGFPIVTDSESSDWDPMDGFSFNVGASF